MTSGVSSIVTAHMAHEVRSKVVDDPHLPDSHKVNVLRACELAVTEDAVSISFTGYARANRLVGTSTLAINPTDQFGHIKTLESVARFMARTIGWSDVSSVQGHLRALCQPGLSLEKREAELWINEELLDHFPDYALSSRPTWLFEREDTRLVHQMLSDPDRSALPCRLGLPEPLLWGPPPYTYPNGIEFLGFAISAPAVHNPRRPTALDGDYDSVKMIWQYGGRTQPLPHGPDHMRAMGGLGEVVSEPVRLSLQHIAMYVFEN